MTLFFRRFVGLVLGAACLAGTIEAQPPLGQMSGIPLPDPQLPDGTITVRVVRGSVTNNVSNQQVELRQGDLVETATTDSDGRAIFSSLDPGIEVQATTVLDSRLLQSQSFSIPIRGGIRLMLVGADPDIPVDLSRPGNITFGSESWIQIEIVEESIEVYYFFDVFNPLAELIDSSVPIILELPDGAEGTTVLRGSSPRTIASGRIVELPGPFESGGTPLHLAYILPYSGGSMVLSQLLPVSLESVLVSLEKWEKVNFESPQIERRMEMPSEGHNQGPYILGAGPSIRGGESLVLELSGLPYRSALPSRFTLIIAAGIIVFGFWSAFSSTDSTHLSKRKKTLETRREKLFAELVKVEQQHMKGRIGSTKRANRHDELVCDLEKVYLELNA